MMEADVLKILQGRLVNIPGGKDKEDRPIITVYIPIEVGNLEISGALKYVLQIFSDESKKRGFTVIVDARKGPWRVARSCIRQVNTSLTNEELSQFLVLRPDAFWDKQRVENCTSTQKDGQVLFIPRSRLYKYVDQSQLPIELGGNFIFNADQWLENRTKVEEFYAESSICLTELEDVQQKISNMYTLSPSQIQNNHQLVMDRLEIMKIISNNCIEKGRELIQKIEYDNRTRKFASEADSMSTPQDTLDTIDRLELSIGILRRRVIEMENSRKSMKKCYVDTKDLSLLEEGVVKVINWILGPAEQLLKSCQKVGYDVASAEELRKEHESIEMKCWNAYGTYAELLHKIESFANGEFLTVQQKDLISQKDFMDFICRSFATRLERRRNILITSLRFFRLVAEYFDKTGEVFDSLVMGNKIGDFGTASQKLKELQENQCNLDGVERELLKEGEKLSDMLSMPIKDALGREVNTDYSEDIINIRDILDATTARKNIFSDSVELQKLTLEQVSHIYQYETDAAQAVQWLDELFQVLLKDHGHVGCTVYEIQAQKEEHQVFQETAKCTYNYGFQLLNAAVALRNSCKMPSLKNEELHNSLKISWQRLLNVSQEQMTRLRVSAVFHRSVEEQCNQLRDLREAVATIPLMDINKKRVRVRHYFGVRERLLVEVGRMVRLGRLLRSRLRESLYYDDTMSETTAKTESDNIEIVEILDGSENSTAIEAISERLGEVTELAEDLDQALKSAQQDCAISPTAGTLANTITTSKKYIDGTAGSADEDVASTSRFLRVEDVKSDDEFLTASDCTLQHSRSSSYNTASDCEHFYSPWWEYGKDDLHDDLAKEKMVLAVGLPELPLTKNILKPSPDVPPGKIAREVTETTHIKVQQSHIFGVKSFVLTSEKVWEKNSKDNTNRDEVHTIVTNQEREIPIQYGGDVGFETKMKECGDWIQLKILEVTPELTTLGNTLNEALELQKAHDDVLRQLQNKQSPVEELLRQADQLISTQKPRAEVYAAMAESLGRAWKDVNLHLEHRKNILDLNVQYHTHAQLFFERMDELEEACSDTLVPIEIEAVKLFLTKVHDLRRSVLETLMCALQTGNSLIGKLKELGAEGTLDSRPDRIRTSINKAIAQVQSWMDQLHIRRQVLESTFSRRKSQLEQCLALAILAADLRELEDAVMNRRELLRSSDQLGNSSSSAELLQHELKKLLSEAKQLQEKALKITKATEQLVESGCFAGEQATNQAYEILSATSDYLTDLQHRDNLFEKVIIFFRSAQATLTKLDQLEMQLKTSEHPTTSPQLAQLHAQCSKTIEEVTSNPISEGYLILEKAGRDLNTSGVRTMVEELENRKISLDGICVAHKEENRRINQALNIFLEKQEELLNWLVTIAEAFLQGHQDMGSDLSMSQDFLDLHNHLLSDLQTKGNEINNLLLTLPPILEYLNDIQRKEVDQKVETLHERWIKLKNILESRLDLALLFVKFHKDADRVSKEMDTMEMHIQINRTNITDELMKELEEKMENIIPLYSSAKNTGLTFINEANKVVQPHLDTKRACVCVESVLERLSGRQLTVNRNWQIFHTEIIENREVQVLIETNMADSTKTINWVSKLDTQLYPVITTNATNPKDVMKHIEQKLQNVLPEIKRAQMEVEERIHTADTIMAKSQKSDEKTIQIRNKLNDMNQKLIMIINDYHMLVKMMISYFNNLTELDKNIENLNGKYKNLILPKNPPEIDFLIRDHESLRQSINNLIKFAQIECDELVERITQQEPKEISSQDIEKLKHLLQIRKNIFEKDWKERREIFESHMQLCQFDTDLQQIYDTLDDLSRQLSNVKGQYGESLASAKATSLAFVYFEKTIELLEQRINIFVQTGENLLTQQHIHSPHFTKHIKDLQERWKQFKNQIEENRKLINLSIKYFELVDEADDWFREGSKLLVTIARRSTSVKRPEEAQELLNEIEIFLKPGESKQDERIQQISEIGAKLFGRDQSQVQGVLIENRDMMESFNVISKELSTLAHNLKAAEEQRIKMMKEQEEANLQLEAAKAEKAAAEAAAAAAEEAKKAAENAAKLLREATYIHKVEITEIQTKQKSPERIIEPKMEPPIFISPLSDQIIQEGCKFTFICQVTGVPLPVVTWHKDGISIQNNPDYQTTFDQGLCTLTIEETFADDSAKYTCKAINAVGSAETGGFLTVKENEPEEQLIPPSFSRQLEPATVKEGEVFQFQCKVEGNPLPTVQWYKNLECIDNSPDYVITYNNGEAILRFEQIFLDDKADYTCKAVNELGIIQSTANLNVIPSEPTESPAFITPLSNVMARAGQKIKLECEVSGLPPPELIWSHNGKTVKETRELKLHRDGQKATLIIHEAFPKDAGNFTVSASNIVGEVTSACSVSVKGRLPAETSDSELASDMEPIKPSIQVPLKDISINEGNRVRLDCVIVGQPEPEVIWYHDERPVKESPDFQLLFQGDRCSLIIQEALLEDTGRYKVVALNSAGEASSEAVLSVTPVKTTEKDLKPEEEIYPLSGYAPKFHKLLQDILVSEGDKVIFEASVSADPRPDIKWFLNNAPITPNEHIKIFEDNQGNLKLEIDETKHEDRGVYTVKASNSNGDAKCFAQLIVKSLRLSENKIHEEIKIAPSFREIFNDRTAFEKTSTKFECIVQGKPTPKIKWLFNDVLVSGSNFLPSTSGERQVLTIPEITHETAGKITCIAENEAGKAICNANLTVQSSTQISPLDWSIDLQKQSESSITYKHEVNVQSSSLKSSKLITSSTEAPEPHIEEHKFSSQDQKYFKQINQDAPEVKESHKEEEYHKIGKQPPITHEKSTSVYTIGGKEVEMPQITSVQPKPFQKLQKARPPKFVTPVIGKIVDQGADIILEGILDASPPPEVTWMKNGSEFKISDNATVTFEHNRAKLELKNVSNKDAGMYTCTATNEAGKAISTADLVVKKTVFPPVFGRRLQAQVIKEGDRITMDVEVTGTPDPTVSWFKDGLPLDEALKDGFKVKAHGNSHTLVIEKAEVKKHTGKYMVRAINAGGEAQSIADIVVFEPTPDTMVEMVKTVVFEDVQKHETLRTAADKTSETLSSSTEIPSKPIQISVPQIFQKQEPQTIESVTTEISTHTEDQVTHDIKTLTLERTTPLVDIEMPKRFEKPLQIETPFEPQTVVLPHDTIEEGIQTSSISKQQSLNYFVRKLKEVDEPKVKEMIKPSQIKQEMYTKFEDVSGSYEIPKKEEYTPAKFETSQFSTFSSTQAQLLEEFNLTPEPPPEICFTPKQEVKIREDVSQKAKKLEESYRGLSETDVPIGGVKIFPTVPTKPTIISQDFSSSQKTEYYKAETIGPVVRTISPLPEPQKFEESSTIKVDISSELRPISPKPSIEALKMEKIWTPKLEVERPSSSLSLERRPVSALSTSSLEPSMEGLAMEKTWAHKHVECNVQKSWPPQQTEVTKIAPSWSTQSTLEKKWAPVISTETTIKETKILTPVVTESYKKETIVSETLPPPLSVPHYVAQVTHTSNIKEISQSVISEVKKEFVSEEKAVKASEIIKSWPPKPEKEEAPVYKPVVPPVRPVSVQDITDEIYLEPGTPPEIAYAQPPVQRRVSYVETIEQDLEKNLDKVPSKVLPGAVRTIPPPLPPKKEQSTAPPVALKIMKPEPPKKEIPFEKFPELEPFPFKPDPMHPKPMKVAPPPTPSKFIKGRFTDSDYESDFENARIPAKWKPYASDTDEPSFRHVNPPKFISAPRSRSTEKEPLPPSKFDQPPQIIGPPRPAINFEACKQIKKESASQKTSQKIIKIHEVKVAPPPPLKPGTPPEYVQVEYKPKPQSPKTKHKTVVDGYMADTDEPFIQQKKSVKSEYREEKSEFKQIYQSSQSISEQKIQQPKPVSAPKFTHHKKHVSSSASAKKKLVSTPIVTSVSTERIEKSEILEPFPFKPDPPAPTKIKLPPPPSPSKFVKGEFRESDYESDYDGRIQPIWRSGDKHYKPVRPVLSSSGRPQSKERTPTPPTEFDRPEQVPMPSRPKFEPIEKPKKPVKLEEIIKPVPKPTPIFKPKPIVQQAPITDVIIATPAIPEKVILIQPGTPPELAFAPGPKRTQYYRSTTSAPYHNAVQTETSNVMHFNESTEHSHRTVSLQQTTKVIKFGDQRKEEVQPFPFKPDPERPRRSSAPPPPKPSKFIPGEFRESDYESEVENTRIRPKWIPGHSDNEEPHYRKVRAPTATRSSSVPAPKERVITPMEFDKQKPYQPQFRSEQQISKKYGENKSKQVVKSYENNIQPGAPPEYGYSAQPLTKTTATKIASQHMDNMTHTFKSKAQQFVSDIMEDVNKKGTQKPILKPKDETDAQVYREETRAAQYGTKHVDPDTGLIYFKYDFGYEFGIILPGEGKNGEIPVPKKTIIQPPQRSESIEMPVYHEKSGQKAVTPQFQPKKFVAPNKNVKWEPTSESEMSEYEDGKKKGARWEQSSCSPVSLSPSLPSTSPAFNNGTAPGPKGTETPPSCPSTPGIQQISQRAPVFITPLRDIAVVSGQMARFECIVQSEPPPNILWSKNGRIIENSNNHQLFFRNGVCRITIPRAFPEDAGTYTCTASNQIGTNNTTANLQVPGVPSHMYGTYRQLSIGRKTLSPEPYERPTSPKIYTSFVGKSNGNGLRYRLENYE